MTPRTVVISAAQADVVRDLLRDGANDRTIAARLWLTETSIRKHLHHVYRKVGCTTRTELAVAVLRGRLTFAVRGRDQWWKENAA